MLYSLPTVAALLIALAVKMLAGLKKYAVDLGIRSATQIASDAFKAADTAVAEWQITQIYTDCSELNLRGSRVREICG